MSSQDQVPNFKQNVVPKRMDGYFDRKDLEKYLTDRWSNVALKDFRIRAGLLPKAESPRVHLADVYPQERDERISFIAPEEITTAEYESLIASVRESRG